MPDQQPARAASPEGRLPYVRPTLRSLGPIATVTEAVSMQGLMDGFMGRRTG